MPRPPTLAQFLAAQPAPLAAYLRARLVEHEAHWLWTGSISRKSTGGGLGRPKMGQWVETPQGRVWFTLPYRLTLYLAHGWPLPGMDEALHKCASCTRHTGFCCRPHPAHVVFGPSDENWADRRAALLAAGRVPRLGRKPSAHNEAA